MLEQWRDIPGFEGIYQVSDLGRVMKLPQAVLARSSCYKKGVSVRKMPERFLVPEQMKTGLRVVLRDEDNAKRFFFIDRLVLYCFVGPKSGHYPYHKNHNIYDNELSNLEWRNEDEYDRKKQTTILEEKECPYKKRLTEDEVIKAFTDMRDNEVVANEIGISPLCVELIKQRIIWTKFTKNLTRGKRRKDPGDYAYRFPKNLEYRNEILDSSIDDTVRECASGTGSD